MATRILSIDLQHDLLTAVIVKNDINQGILASAAIVTAEKSITELVQELTVQLDCSNCTAVLSLGSSFFAFQNLKLPFHNQKAIDKILPLELGENTAVSIDTMLIDTIVLPAKDEETDVIAAMIKRSIVAECCTAFEQCGTPLEVITLSGLPTIAEIQKTGGAPEEFIFLDLRLTTATLFYIAAGELRLVRPLPFDPHPFSSVSTISIMQDEEDGEITVEGLEHCGEAFRELALAVRQTLLPLCLQSLFEQIPLYIDGTIGSAQGVTSWLEAAPAFNRPCFLCGRPGLLPPPLNLPEESVVYAPYLTASISLAKQDKQIASGFNFCKGEFAPRHALGKYRNKLQLAGGAICIALIFGIAFLWLTNTALEKKRTALTNEINSVLKKTLPETHRIVAPVQQLKVAVNSSKTDREGGTSTPLPKSVLLVLKEISSRIPPSLDIVVTRMVYEDQGLRITGTTNSFNTVDAIKRNLEQSHYFSTVTIASTKQNPQDNRIRFELKITVMEGV